MIQGDGDPVTQYDGGPAMAAELGSQLISVRDSGPHDHYGSNQCVTDKIDNYLMNGVLPPSRSECAAEPRPPVPTDTAKSNRGDTPKRTNNARVLALPNIAPSGENGLRNAGLDRP
ncbi:alpha/beta hydrolase [Kibdelosporangium aridum]|uniref:TAP-like protein n=1 Tax=Kibdelosporangium aridum TaxID=2030 RepID=A0A1Y5Y945_KIBAR|nr:alpha/beta hydrolase [Kibdelosporangium aridum]SMD27404.1 TAP-like protein [Kibdelosporangium aridum]